MADEQSEKRPRKVVVVDETMATDGGYIPALVTEGEPGFAPLSGSGDFAAPWVWGPSIEQARRQAREYNARMGHDSDAVAEVVLSALRATAVRDAEWRRQERGQ